jgi:hypothetical protein
MWWMNYLVDRFAVLDLDEGASRAADVLQVEHSVLKPDLGVVAADALVENEDLVRAVPADFSTVFFD